MLPKWKVRGRDVDTLLFRLKSSPSPIPDFVMERSKLINNIVSKITI